MKPDNLIGQRFGLLTVIERRPSKNGHSNWLCKCDCGTEKEILGTNLKTGKIVSCGCYHKKLVSQMKTKDLTGQKFGKLTVLERVSPIGENHMKWKCQCDCGNVVTVAGTALKQGITKSCGCTRSIGEQKIREILDNSSISYATEYTFSDLPKLRFDFAIFQNNKLCYLIEFDGRQHFEHTNNWNQTEKEYQATLKRDKEKNQYCLSHNIPLYRIPYTYRDTITYEELTNEKFRVKETKD